MKYYVDFPLNAPGGYGGRHHFFSKREGAAFISRYYERCGQNAMPHFGLRKLP